MEALPKSDRVLSFFVDSPGGSIVEASKIAELISKTDTPVTIPGGSQCSSACFLLFAAARRRIMAPDALIGVHSVSEGDRESLAAMAVTTAFAREAAAYGVPPVIIGKMVQTQPGRMAWLTPTDLQPMGVVLLDLQPSPSAPQVQPRQLPSEPTAPAVAVSPSFPCARASLAVEVAVCNSTLLANLDFQLAGIYAFALQSSRAKHVKKQQRSWLERRNACGSDAACIEQRYREQISALRFSTQPKPQPEPNVQAYPSFPCATASLAAEVAICNSAALARLDVQLSALYAAVKRSRNAKQYIGKQRAWLKRRNACGSDTACLEQRYQEQILFLQGAH
jgi:uncharacterized protein